MINPSAPFYYNTLRNIVVTFGSMFSDIRIVRKENDKIIQNIRVPIAYGQKDKYIQRLKGDPKLQGNMQINLPVMSFDIQGYEYDGSRKVNQQNKITLNNGTALQVYSPVPYNVRINLYCYTKTMEDNLMIIEQILPFFGPEVNVTVKVIPEMDINQDVPFILNNVNTETQYTESFEEYRAIVTTFSFTAKINLFGPIQTAKVIKSVNIDLDDLGTYSVAASPTDVGPDADYTLVEEITGG